MRRSFRDVLKQESPVSLAREAIWRTRKRWYRDRVLARLDEESCPVKFREVHYYASGVPDVHPTSRALIIAWADEICEGRFPFLGYGTQELGREPKWNVDFISALEWPSAPIRDHEVVRLDGSDVKVPYELSRLQFLPILGKAYVLTKDERYRQNAKRLLSHWIEKNPVGIGVNWSIAMEAALRAMSICLLLNLISPLRPEEEGWLETVTRSLWHHFVYVEAHIEFSYLISSNHYLSNLVGLYCLSESLEGRKMSAKRRLYRQRVESEILRQVYDDGGDYEASIGYHVLVTQMFTSTLLLMRASKVAPEPIFLERLRRMYSIMDELASPSGQLPHVGDCDDGRVELLLDDLQQMLWMKVAERNSLRVSRLLGIGKSLFGGRNGSTEDAKWYGLSEATTLSFCPASHKPRPNGITLFPKSGIAIVRAEQAEVLFFAVPNGICGKGSHTHNDKLSFVLRLDGEEVLCDPGTGTYTRDARLRNHFRATAAHNCVVIDGQEQNTIEHSRSGLFWIGTEAEVGPIEQWCEHGSLCLRAWHSGYKNVGVMHTRTICFPKERPAVMVEDELDGNGAHTFEINFQLAPDWKVNSLDTLESEILVRVSGRRGLQISCQSVGNIYAEQRTSLMSMSYGALTQSSSLRFWGESTFPTKLTTTFSWEV